MIMEYSSNVRSCIKGRVHKRRYVTELGEGRPKKENHKKS